MKNIHFDYRISLKTIEYEVNCLHIHSGDIGNKKNTRSGKLR
nr:hypothetical protein [Buchnera aphidicola]